MVVSDSGRITSSKLSNQSFANLYNLINNRSNVADPNSLDGNRKFVYPRLPNMGCNFAGFPFIVISRTRPAQRGNTASLTRSMVDFDFMIRIYSQDKDSDSDGNAEGAEQINLITDDIIETLNNTTNRKGLIFNDMSNMSYDIDTDEDELDGKTVFVTEFDLRFEGNIISTG